jgi:HAD superfamily hydrolase (TIGR01509 family)
MTPRWRAVLWDLDGTLVDSRGYWFEVLAHTARTLGAPPVERAAFDASFGQSVEADHAQFIQRGTPADVHALYDAAVPTHAHLVKPLQGMPAILTALRTQGHRHALCTNSTSPFVHAVMRSTGLGALLDVLCCAEEVEHPKPAPDLIRLALRRLDVAPQDAVMVGDSPFDVEAARAAGVWCVGLHVPADVTVTRVEDLPGVLAG